MIIMSRIFIVSFFLISSYSALAESCEKISGVYTLFGDILIPLPRSYVVISIDSIYRNDSDVKVNEMRMSPIRIDKNRFSKTMPDGLIIREAISNSVNFNWNRYRRFGEQAEIKSRKIDSGYIHEIYYQDRKTPDTSIFESDQVQIVVLGNDSVYRLECILKKVEPISFLGQ